MGGRKGLSVPLETFFTAVALKCGAPMQRYFDYVHHQLGWKGQQLKGIGVWVHNTPEGKVYMDLVQQFGEAKSRATHWYIKYARWYAKAKANYHQPALVADSHSVLIAASKYSWDDQERKDAKQELARLAACRGKSSRAASKR